MTDETDPDYDDDRTERRAPNEDRSTRATLRTTHEDAGTVAAALRPDNTPDIETTVEDETVVTTVRRRRASGLRSTVDDYLVNVDVAERTVRTVTDHTTRQ